MYQDRNYSIRNDKLQLVKNFVFLGKFTGGKQYFWFLYILLKYAVITGQTIYLLQVWGNLTQMTGTLATFAIEIQATYKIWVLYWQSKLIDHMHKTIENDFWDFDVANQKLKAILDHRMKLTTRVLCTHLFCGILCSILYMSFPLAKYPSNIRQLPIQCWFPFNTNPSPLHEILYFILAFNGILCIIAIAIFDFSFIYFAQHLLAQFCLLKMLLKNLTQDVMNIEDDLDKIHNKAFQKEIYRRMSVYVRHHNVLLSFGRKLETHSSISIAIQLFVSMATFVIIGFILSTDNKDSAKAFKLVFYFLCISLQLAIYAVLGSELQNQSASVANAAYFCEWYLGNGSLRRGLVLLQMRARKEIRISAAGCIDLNNRTLVSVYRSAFSCVTLLQAIDQI